MYMIDCVMGIASVDRQQYYIFGVQREGSDEERVAQEIRMRTKETCSSVLENGE